MGVCIQASKITNTLVANNIIEKINKNFYIFGIYATKETWTIHNTIKLEDVSGNTKYGIYYGEGISDTTVAKNNLVYVTGAASYISAGINIVNRAPNNWQNFQSNSIYMGTPQTTKHHYRVNGINFPGKTSFNASFPQVKVNSV